MFVERERHTVCRPGNQSYPSRMIRTHQFMYIRNLRPELWPAGDPDLRGAAGYFSDIDGSPTKKEVVERRDDPAVELAYKLACAKRPAEELFDLSKDPEQVDNVAGELQYAQVQKRLRAALDKWMRETADPRAAGETDFWDKASYKGR